MGGSRYATIATAVASAILKACAKEMYSGAAHSRPAVWAEFRHCLLLKVGIGEFGVGEMLPIARNLDKNVFIVHEAACAEVDTAQCVHSVRGTRARAESKLPAGARLPAGQA